jgi:4-amino-4-deoxy-L-arabinose transferase-like glycosyltransferase
MLTTRRVLVIVFVVAAALRLGYGIAAHRHVLTASGSSFIALWDHDALEHVLIAKAIGEGKGYIVDSDVDLTDKHPRLVGGPAIFKAPLYQYLLATVFSLSGFSFALFFPLQVLLGSGVSILVAKIAMEAFGNSPPVGLYAGLAAAAHQVLVNTASQPYNENVFFFLLFLLIWLFFRWMRSLSWKYAILCGVLAGLTTLTRESAILPFLVMIVVTLLFKWRDLRMSALSTGATMAAVAALTILPWTLHNYRQFGVILPVSSITGTSLGMGNNECVAAGGLFVPYDGEIGCPPLDVRRRALAETMPKEPAALWSDRVYGTLGRQFVTQHPADYLRLSFRRAWTTFLPLHPRQGIGGLRQLIVVSYFVLVIGLGFVSLVVGLKKGLQREAKLLIWVALANYIPLAAIYVSSDLRYRTGIDLILGCFAGYGFSLLVARVLQSRGLQRHMPGFHPSS